MISARGSKSCACTAWPGLDEFTTCEGKPNDVGIKTSRWLIEDLLRPENEPRAFASVRHQMKAAKVPLHRDLAGFDFESSRVDKKLVNQLSTLEFTETAQNAVLIGGPGMGNTHLATAIAVTSYSPENQIPLRSYSCINACLSRADSRTSGAPDASPQD